MTWKPLTKSVPTQRRRPRLRHLEEYPAAGDCRHLRKAGPHERARCRFSRHRLLEGIYLDIKTYTYRIWSGLLPRSLGDPYRRWRLVMRVFPWSASTGGFGCLGENQVPRSLGSRFESPLHGVPVNVKRGLGKPFSAVASNTRAPARLLLLWGHSAGRVR